MLRQMPANDLPNNVSPTSDEIVTQIITLKNVSAARWSRCCGRWCRTYGHLAAYPRGNMLIISDRASNVSRIVRIIQRMDESGDEPIEVIPLHNAGAAEVVRIVNASNQGRAPRRGGAIVKIVADERTNSVLLTGETSAAPAAQGLDPQYGHALGDRRRHPGPVSALCRRREDRREAQGTGHRHGQGSGRPLPRVRHRPAPAAAASNVDASVTIWADVATNALIITAPPKIMKSLMAVIDKLDIRRAQVHVEAIIVEIDVNKSSNLGRAMAAVRPGRHRLCRPA